MGMLLFIGTTELLLIGGIALLLFGGKKLPEMMRGLGQGVKEFKKGMNDMGSSLDVEDGDGPQVGGNGAKEDAVAGEDRKDSKAGDGENGRQ